MRSKTTPALLLLSVLIPLLAGCATQPSRVPMNYRWATVEGNRLQDARAGEQFYFHILVDEGMIAEGAPVKIKVGGNVTDGSIRFQLRRPDGQAVWNSGVIGPGGFSISAEYDLPAGQVGTWE